MHLLCKNYSVNLQCAVCGHTQTNLYRDKNKQKND